MPDVATILLGLIITLVLGGYAYTYAQGRDLYREIRSLWTRFNNHTEHRFEDVERRISSLEFKTAGRDTTQEPGQ